MRSRTLLYLLCTLIGLARHAAVAQDAELDTTASSLQEMLDIPVDADGAYVPLGAAARYDQIGREAPASITIITAEEIERFGYRTLRDVFASVRGFYVSDDRNYAYVGVRGFSRPTDYNNRILLLLNGTTLNENIWASTSIGTDLGLSLDAVERIEIVRGPGSALYGTNAMLAVVNVITKTGNGVDGLRASAELGSYGLRVGRALYGKAFASGLDVSLAGQWWNSDGQDLYFREYDDPATNNGIAEDLDWDENLGVTARATWGGFGLHGLFVTQETAIPTGSYGVDFNDSRSTIREASALLQLKYEHEIDASRNLMLRSYVNHYYERGGYPYDGILETEFGRGDWVGSELQYRWDTHPSNRLVLGAEYQKHLRSKFWVTEEVDGVYVEGNDPFDHFSFYVQNEYQLTSRLVLTSGLRWDEHSTVGGHLSPRGALVYHFSEFDTFKLLYGEAFRAPSSFEAKYEELDYAKLNPDLGPEEIRTVEAIWERQLTRALTTSAVVYDYTMRDLIEWTIDPADGLGQFRNISRIDARGIELGLGMRRRNGARGHASYSFQRAENARSHRRLSNSPSHLVKGGLSYPFAGHFYATSILQYDAGRSTVFGTRTDPYLLIDLRLSAGLRPKGHEALGSLFDAVRVSLAVNNLLDTSYGTPGGHEHRQAAIAQDGRSYVVRVHYER